MNVVVGGGLAGVFLTHELLSRQLPVTLIDGSDSGSLAASNLSAGLFNIITGKRLALLPDTLVKVQYLLNFFSSQPAAVQKCLHLVPIFRRLDSHFEYNKWLSIGGNMPEINDWIAVSEQGPENMEIAAPFGWVQLNGCGWVAVPELLSVLKNEFAINPDYHFINQYVTVQCIGSDYIDTVRGKLYFERLFFCHGPEAGLQSLWQPGHIFRLKGQFLIIELASRYPTNAVVLGQQLYCIPQTDERLYVGATYERLYHSDLPTTEVKNLLLEQLRQLTNIDLAIKKITHLAGFRATTPLRLPLLGRHPIEKRWYYFNGLGTRGVLNAPFYAAMLADMVMGKLEKLPAAVDVSVQWNRVHTDI
jgi:glycine/D-amino acid oxidase-like deaminating enzyme